MVAKRTPSFSLSPLLSPLPPTPLILPPNSIFIQNHDQARCVSRFGNDTTPRWRALSAKLLAMMETTLSGTLYIYQGEEIGMVNAPRRWGIEEYKDVATQNYYKR